jgi:esterase/lipase superfamily enzyme
VWFGTNRKPNDSESLQLGFSKSRDMKIHYGYCRVFIPESHKIGSTGSSWWQRLRSGMDDRLKLIEVKGMVADAYWSAISSRLAKLETSERDAVIFVHGYNVSFENAAMRAAQIGFDLSVKGAMAFFSWPSQGALKGYSADEATIEASEPFIAEFIEDFVARSGAEKVHIIAHSMGNRGVLRAIDRIANRAQRRTGVLIGQVILAAADVDADTFRNLCGAYGRVSRRTTLYVSSRDRAIEASRWLHDFARAGLLPPIMVVPGIDTINVTNVDLTKLGHGYIAGARGVLEDMHQLLVYDAPPDRRFSLRQGETDAGERYWIIGR